MILFSIKLGVDLKRLHCLSKYVLKEPCFIKTVVKLHQSSDAANLPWPPRLQHAKGLSESYWLPGFIQPWKPGKAQIIREQVETLCMNKKGSDGTHSSLEVQLVRVPRLLECLILRAEAAGWGLQDSLGSSRVPEESLFTPHLISGSGRGSRKMSCSEESHFLWEKRAKKQKKNVTRFGELGDSSLNGLVNDVKRKTNLFNSGKTIWMT